MKWLTTCLFFNYTRQWLDSLHPSIHVFIAQTYTLNIFLLFFVWTEKVVLVVQGWACSGLCEKRWDEVFWSFWTQIYQPSACVVLKSPNSENRLKPVVTYCTFVTGIKEAKLFSSPKKNLHLTDTKRRHSYCMNSRLLVALIPENSFKQR